MGLGEEGERAAQTLLNTAARRLLLWKDWWRDNGLDLLSKAPEGNDPYTLGEHSRKLSEVSSRLNIVRNEATTAVDEVTRYASSGAIAYGGSDLWGGADEVRTLSASLESTEQTLDQQAKNWKELEEAARRLLAEQKAEEEEKKAG